MLVAQSVDSPQSSTPKLLGEENYIDISDNLHTRYNSLKSCSKITIHFWVIGFKQAGKMT